MLSFLPSFLVGIITSTLCILNLFFCSLPLYLLGILKFIFLNTRFSKYIERLVQGLVKFWQVLAGLIYRLMLKTEWDIEGLEGLSRKEWYFFVANHSSWTDIMVLQHIFNRHAPFLKFFLKQELKWVFLVSLPCWIGGFPFVRRYSKAFLEKYPEKKGEDVEITKRACEYYKEYPTSIINFLEGTRFTEEKQVKQNSPYRHLLKPKAGGAALAIDIMHEYLSQIIDVTLVYPQGNVTAWDFFCGRVKKIVVRVKKRPVKPDYVGDYNNDLEFKAGFQAWINEIWEEKDQEIDDILKEYNPDPTTEELETCP